MGAAWLIYDRHLKELCVSDIAIWNVGNKKTKISNIMDSIADLLYRDNVRDWVHVCILEKQGGMAQKKVIRVEQHISTLLRYGLNIPVYMYDARMRNKSKPKDMKTPAWLTTRCREIIASRAQQGIMTMFNKLTAKQKTDVGAAILQVETLFDKIELLAAVAVGVADQLQS